MEKIDLTKCNNCRFRAKDEDGDISGRIRVSERGAVYLFVDGRGNNGFLADRMQKMGITDFEIVPRDPETYRDWQVGDLIGNADGSSGMIIFRSGEFVVADIGGCRCRTCRELFDEGYCLMLTDIEEQIIEEQIIEEKKKYGPQDGDIVAWKDKEDNGPDAVSIYKGKDRGYATMFTNGDIIYSPYTPLAMNIIRPATEEEKQKLFDAMKKNGKRWNAKKKVVEDIPKPYEFKKGEPVLVRSDYGKDWMLVAYVELSSNPDAVFGKYGVTDGRTTIFYRFCLPYNERTMHLLGTTEDYKEE